MARTVYPDWFDQAKESDDAGVKLCLDVMRDMYRVNNSENAFARRCQAAETNLLKRQCIQAAADYIGTQDGPVWGMAWPFPVVYA